MIGTVTHLTEVAELEGFSDALLAVILRRIRRNGKNGHLRFWRDTARHVCVSRQDPISRTYSSPFPLTSKEWVSRRPRNSLIDSSALVELPNPLWQNYRTTSPTMYLLNPPKMGTEFLFARTRGYGTERYNGASGYVLRLDTKDPARVIDVCRLNIAKTTGRLSKICPRLVTGHMGPTLFPINDVVVQYILPPRPVENMLRLRTLFHPIRSFEWFRSPTHELMRMYCGP